MSSHLKLRRDFVNKLIPISAGGNSVVKLVTDWVSSFAFDIHSSVGVWDICLRSHSPDSPVSQFLWEVQAFPSWDSAEIIKTLLEVADALFCHEILVWGFDRIFL